MPQDEAAPEPSNTETPAEALDGQDAASADSADAGAEAGEATAPVQEGSPRHSGADLDGGFPANGMIIFSLILFFKLFLARGFLFAYLDLGRTFMTEFGFLLLGIAVIQVLFYRWRTPAFLVFNSALTVVLLAVMVFHGYSGRIVTFESIALLEQVPAVSGSVFALLKPGYILFVLDIFVMLYMRIRRGERFNAPRMAWRNIGWTAAVGAFLAIYAVFGGPQLDNSDSNTLANQRGLFVYQIEHAMGRHDTAAIALGSETIDVSDELSLQERIEQLKGTQPPAGEPLYFGEAEGRHVFAIQVESLQSFAVGLDVGGESVTPRLDELLADSFYFSRIVQQIGAGNTSDSEFMFNTSLYPLESQSVAVEYGDRAFPSLPRLLGERGYATFTLHANEVTFWNRDELYPALGFERYYELPYFEGGEVIGIGPHDAVLFERGLEAIEAEIADGSPAYGTFVTLTQHHPFELPEQFQTLDLPEGIEGTLVGHYLQSTAYSDARIGEFVDGLKERGLYEDSLIVIYGDHFGLQLDTMTAADKEAIRQVLGHDYTLAERLVVPLMVVAPGIAPGATSDAIGGQIDIMPTLANLLGVPLDGQVHFGQDLLNDTGTLLGMRYYLQTGTFVNERILLIPNNGLAEAATYDMSSGQPTWEAAQFAAEYENVQKLQGLSDVYIESLPER